MEKILRELLAKDKMILGRRDELIEALEEKVPTNLMRDYTAIRRAIYLNVAEMLLVGESDKDATKTKIKQILKSSGMQEARIDFVVDTFTKALDWDKPQAKPVEETKPVIANEKVLAELQNLKKFVTEFRQELDLQRRELDDKEKVLDLFERKIARLEKSLNEQSKQKIITVQPPHFFSTVPPKQIVSSVSSRNASSNTPSPEEIPAHVLALGLC